MAQILVDLDRRIARSAGLPAFLQRHIQFKEASGDERPSIVTYSSANQLTAKKVGCLTTTGQACLSTLRMDWSSIGRVGAGLRNLGNTCFLNATLQCLMYTVPLHLHLTLEHRKSDCLATIKGEHCMLCDLTGLFKSMSSSSQPIAPNSVVGRLKGIARHMKLGRQEDAHEFLRYFIDSLQKSALSGMPIDCGTDNELKQTSLIYSIFGGRLRSSITCSRCSHKSTTNDPFLDISLDIKNSESILDSLNLFCKHELLSKGNRYRCESCGELSEASKQMLLDQLPPVITFHLKRFSASGVSCHPVLSFGKLNKHVDFPCELDMSSYCTTLNSPRNTKYRLYGVLVHEGHSTHSGHYYAFIRASNSMWYCMNDESVTQVSINTVLKQKAYILFYQQIVSSKQQDSEAVQEDFTETINLEECSETSSTMPCSNTMWHMTCSSNTTTTTPTNTNANANTGKRKKKKQKELLMEKKYKWHISHT